MNAALPQGQYSSVTRFSAQNNLLRSYTIQFGRQLDEDLVEVLGYTIKI